MNFTFSRAPSVKTQVQIQSTSLAQINNTLVLVGRKAVSGASAAAYVPYNVQNGGDPVAALTELTSLFGATSEITLMAIAAINANQASGNFIPLIMLPLTSVDTTVAPAVTANMTLSAQFFAFGFDGVTTQAVTDGKAFLQAISAGDRGTMGQFGAFGFYGLISTSTVATPIGIAGASQNLLFAWLRDGAGTPANTPAQIAAWTAALCAANGYPFLPMTDVSGAGLTPPVSQSDWHTPGDAGSEALGLVSGLIPLMSSTNGSVSISRTVTSIRTLTGTPDAEYFDLQDWQSLYYIVQDFFTLSSQPRYKIAKLSQPKLNALKSEFISHLKTMEKGTDGTDGLVQGVDQLAAQILVQIDPSDRSAATIVLPVDIVPGWYNKGIGLIGTDTADGASS